MKADLKSKLIGRLDNYPLLRQLVLEFWFRTAFLVCAVLLILFPLFTRKIWTVSPPGVQPRIRISGLDLVQAWSLKRNAVKAMANGKNDEAAYAWQAAINNNPADPELVRGALRNVQSMPLS